MTTTAVSKRVEEKKDDPRNANFEEELGLWKSDEDNSMNVRCWIGRILGTFRWNFARPDLTIHIQLNATKIRPTAETTLLSIYEALTNATRAPSNSWPSGQRTPKNFRNTRASSVHR